MVVAALTSESLLGRIRQGRDKLRRSEQKVADLVLARPDFVTTASLAAVAGEAGISEPTVLRFCAAFGCNGFQDFRLRLARALGAGTPFVHRSIGPDDPVAAVGEKICTNLIAVLQDLPRQLDWAAIDRAVAALASARRIEFHGAGASGTVALDAEHKFFRLSVPVAARIDAHMQVMGAAALQPGDALVSFSYTGRSRDVVAAARLAACNGAAVIAVTAANSPLAASATHLIALPALEDTSVYTPMLSRMLELVVVDTLEIGVALRRGPGMVNHLKRLKQSLALVRIEDETGGAAA